MTFDDFFKKAMGDEEAMPFPYQRFIATAPELPQLLDVPTGAGKTAAVILTWLWRRRFAVNSENQTPRRLVYCLPMRVLVEQTRGEAERWLKNLGLSDEIKVHVLMGGEKRDDWDQHPEREAILIGTQDMLLSRALNRGYGSSRYRWPMSFALLNNDCLWVMDEIQLMGSGLATTTQLESFRKKLGTVVTVQSLWMSATLMPSWLETVDFKDKVPHLRRIALTDDDKSFEKLKPRYEARKPIEKAMVSGDRTKSPVEHIRRAHVDGSLTLVVINTVDGARELYEDLQKGQSAESGKKSKKAKSAITDASPQSHPELLLIHSRFRPHERAEKLKSLQSDLPERGRIVVSTQVIEAGVNISAKTLFTELAPWPSLVQRFGRCNRFGLDDDAKVFWIDLNTSDKKSQAAPYSEGELNAARAVLEQDELGDVGIATLEQWFQKLSVEKKAALFPYTPEHVARRKDLIELFDTTPDLAGNDIDIARFIRDGDELDVQVYWRALSVDEPPDKEERAPRREELCSVPFLKFRDFLKDKSAFRWDALERGWKKAVSDAVFPGQVFLVPSHQAGYDPIIGWVGWDPKRAASVDPLPPLEAEPLESYDVDQWSELQWQSIAEHTNEVVAEVKKTIETLPLNETLRKELLIAARWHDRGKAHRVFQDAIRDGADRPELWRGRGDLAKAPKAFWTRYVRPHFRHELASALAMIQAGLTDLAVYLAAAHHGKVRLSIRSLPEEKRPTDGRKRFARGVWDDDGLREVSLGEDALAPEVTLRLEVMELGRNGDQPSWAERMLRLRDDPGLGPFRLAFLETVLRAADMRASAAHDNRMRGRTDA